MDMVGVWYSQQVVNNLVRENKMVVTKVVPGLYRSSLRGS